jgi:acetoin utilization protein AcuC
VTKRQLHIAYGDEYLNWQLGKGHPTNPERAKYAVNYLTSRLGKEVRYVAPEIHQTDRDKLLEIHDPNFVSEVLDFGISGDWQGKQLILGETALHMFSGTARLVDLMLSGEAAVGFNPQGAKHHAQWDRSSGFCVFNDMAWAATRFLAEGMTVMYIDWDAHHGDGVENLLLDTKAVTASIHEGGIFPGTGNSHIVEKSAYNWALPHEAGSSELNSAITGIYNLAEEVKPDVVLLAIGADAHETDPLSSLRFDYDDYHTLASMASRIALKHADGRVLIGGAGGYQPHTHTPVIWSTVVAEVYYNVTRGVAHNKRLDSLTLTA